jgi:DNA-binding CsgD family transcriptional regulator
LADLWRRFVEGRLFLRSILRTESRSCALLEERSGPCRVTSAKLGAFERLMLGQSQKEVAAELGCSISSVSSAARECLLAFSYGNQPSRTPLLFFMAAHAAHGFPVCRARIEPAGPGRWLLSIEQPDTQMRGKLPAAELNTACLLIEGKTYQEMAVLRRTSPRTVANQLSAVFRKLGVSGRSELLSKLVRGELR